MGETKYDLEIYDTAGHNMTELRLLVYPGTAVFLVCYSVAYRKSLETVLNFHARDISNFMPNTPMILVGNKLDLAVDGGSSYVNVEEAEAVAKKIGATASFQCSALCEYRGTPSNVGDVFTEAIKTGLIFLIEESEKKDRSQACASCKIV